MKEFALNKDTSSNRSSIEEDESGEQSSLISANKLTNSNSDSDMTNNNYSHNDFQNSNVNIDINLSKETSGTHKATDNYSSSNNNSSNKNHSNHSSNNKSNQKTNNNNNNKKENKDNDIIIPPEDLALLTPSALKLLKFRQVIRLVGFITFAIVGKMCLFSFILPFWGETQSIVKYVSPGVYETSTLHIGVLFKYISDGPNHPSKCDLDCLCGHTQKTIKIK